MAGKPQHPDKPLLIRVAVSRSGPVELPTASRDAFICAASIPTPLPELARGGGELQFGSLEFWQRCPIRSLRGPRIAKRVGPAWFRNPFFSQASVRNSARSAQKSVFQFRQPQLTCAMPDCNSHVGRPLFIFSDRAPTSAPLLRSG